MQLTKSPSVYAFSLAYLLGLGGCSDSHAVTPSPGNEDVIYENGATDEALLELQARTLDGTKTIKLSSPTAAQALSAKATTGFVWAEPTAKAGLLDYLIGTAHAHGTPVNGAAYLLTISSASNPNLVRVFTTKLQYSPSAEIWTKLVGASGLTVKVLGATFEDNKIPVGTGVYASPAVPFSVTP